MSNFLDKIKQNIQLRADNISTSSDLKPNSLDFCQIFMKPVSPVIIAEIKFASPSLGRIYHGQLEVTQIAKSYLHSRASALSILTEPNYFAGNIEYINEVHKAIPNAHILLKDFVLSKTQIAQGLEYGANAILLIVAFLSGDDLKKLYEYAISLNLTPIIEVHDLQELEIALALNPKIIGINNRNLQTLKIDLDTSRNLIKYIPKHIYAICESGIESKDQMEEMQKLGFSGFLVGTSFMKENDPGQALENILLGNVNAR